MIFNLFRHKTSSKLLETLGSYIDAVYIDPDKIGVAATSLVEVPEREALALGDIPDGENIFVAQLCEPSTTGAFAPVAAYSSARSLAERLDELDESFAQTVLRLIDERGLKDSQVYKRANMSRQLFAKIRKDDNYHPTKKTACALAIALELNLDDASALLERAGFALSHSSKFDVIIEYFLMNNHYDVMQINEALYAYDQPLLS